MRFKSICNLKSEVNSVSADLDLVAVSTIASNNNKNND